MNWRKINIYLTDNIDTMIYNKYSLTKNIDIGTNRPFRSKCFFWPGFINENIFARKIEIEKVDVVFPFFFSFFFLRRISKDRIARADSRMLRMSHRILHAISLVSGSEENSANPIAFMLCSVRRLNNDQRKRRPVRMR